MRNCRVFQRCFGPFHKRDYCTRCHYVSEHPTKTGDESNRAENRGPRRIWNRTAFSKVMHSLTRGSPLTMKNIPCSETQIWRKLKGDGYDKELEIFYLSCHRLSEQTQRKNTTLNLPKYKLGLV
jgi:hypothetical protein